jgi:hypothetical protein
MKRKILILSNKEINLFSNWNINANCSKKTMKMINIIKNINVYSFIDIFNTAKKNTIIRVATRPKGIYCNRNELLSISIKIPCATVRM